MIDAASFANSYNAFWQMHAPMCEHFVRRLNMDGLDRFENPMNSSETVNRAYIAEYAFSLFVEVASDESSQIVCTQADIHTRAKLQTDRRLASYGEEGLVLLANFTREEEREIREISAALRKFFTKKYQNIIMRPVLSGCGFIDASEADIIADNTIFEIKTVDRKIRSKDVRQIVTYAALNSASKQFTIDNAGIVNPRKGQFFVMSLEEICSRISGMTSPELLSLIIDAVSTGGISR